MIQKLTSCDICGITPMVVIDGATKGGSWAYMCKSCHKEVGKGMGTGRGHEYDNITGHSMDKYALP